MQSRRRILYVLPSTLHDASPANTVRVSLKLCLCHGMAAPGWKLAEPVLISRAPQRAETNSRSVTPGMPAGNGSHWLGMTTAAEGRSRRSPDGFKLAEGAVLVSIIFGSTLSAAGATGRHQACLYVLM